MLALGANSKACDPHSTVYRTKKENFYNKVYDIFTFSTSNKQTELVLSLRSQSVVSFI